MLDELRLHARGRLPPAYDERSGAGRDGRCCEFLGVRYDELKQTVLAGLSDEAVLAWRFKFRRNPSEHEIYYFCLRLKKLGWRDKATPILKQQLKDHRLEKHPEIKPSSI